MGGIDKIAQGMGYLSKTRPLKALGNAWNKNPESVLAGATVASIILKDGIGCAMYVTQSLNNKKIPDENPNVNTNNENYIMNKLILINNVLKLFGYLPE